MPASLASMQLESDPRQNGYTCDSFGTENALIFLDVDPFGDFIVDQVRMVRQQYELRIERFSGDDRPLQTPLGPVGSRDAVGVNELVATQHAVSEELGRLVEGVLAGLRFRSGFGPVEPQNRELYSFWNEGGMEPGRAQRAINRLQGGGATEEIEQAEHPRMVAAQVKERSRLLANTVYDRLCRFVEIGFMLEHPQSRTIIFGFDPGWTDSSSAPGAICAIAFDAQGKADFDEPRFVSFTQAHDFIESR